VTRQELAQQPAQDGLFEHIQDCRAGTRQSRTSPALHPLRDQGQERDRDRLMNACGLPARVVIARSGKRRRAAVPAGPDHRPATAPPPGPGHRLAMRDQQGVLCF